MVSGANAQDPQGWKRLWGLWGVGLRLKEQKGPRHAPHPWSQRAGDLTWELSRLPGPEWAGQMPSAPLALLLQGPSRLPLLISPASLLCPQAPTKPGGGFGSQGTSLGAQQAPWPPWAGQSPTVPLSLLLDGPFCLPLLISQASLLCPQTHVAWVGLWSGLGVGKWLGSSAGSPA